MAKKTIVKFNSKAFKKRLMEAFVKEQTIRLISYAEKRIKEIGDDIGVYNSRNNLDRTGNLLDSLCWAVYFDGKMQDSGYYRSAMAIEDSNLHEWSNPKGMDVDGHLMAQNFISTYKPKETNGWEVFFAVLAPYWGYWEEGHVNIRNGSIQKWSVMAMNYDKVKKDLSSATVTFHNYVPSY